MSALRIGNHYIHPGERKKINVDMARLYDFTAMKMPVEVIRGGEDGPTLLVSAVIHGDEINGVDIIRRLLQHPAMKKIHGTLIAVPIVNVFGFNDKSRYLPDRRDLNRCFPGDKNGSLGSQVAYIFRTEIVSKCTHGIDLHTAAFHRRNLPQIRANLSDPATLRLAKAFGTSVILNSGVRDGSLREMVQGQNIPMLLYEGGAALRFDKDVSRIGLHGILAVMHEIGMLPHLKQAEPRRGKELFIAHSSHWIRAPHSGIFLEKKGLGDKVCKDELLGHISNPFGDHVLDIRAISDGVVIGKSQLPLANEGDALYHIATFQDVGPAYESAEPPEHFDPVNIPVKE